MNCTGPDCTRPAHGKGTLCKSHLAQLYRGTELAPLKSRSRDRTDELIRQGAEAKPGACVLSDGAGRLLTPQATRGGKRTTAARAVWEAVHGPITGDLEVLHWCQDMRCLNVHHLYLGTAADNAADRKAVYEIGRQIVAARVQQGGRGVAFGADCDEAPTHPAAVH
jgi:hypothetical protein